MTIIEKNDDRVEIDMQGHETESDMSEKVAHVNIDIPRQCCQLELCCKLTINEKMDKFIQQENSLPTLDLRCKECAKNICNECLMENSKMSLIQKKLFLKTWQSIQVVRKDGELRVEADISYKNDPLQTFEPENSNFDQALANLNQVIRSLQKKEKQHLTL